MVAMDLINMFLNSKYFVNLSDLENVINFLMQFWMKINLKSKDNFWILFSWNYDILNNFLKF